MQEVILLPFGDQGHIDDLLTELSALAEQGREEEFALILPTSQLLHAYRRRLVQRASRQLNLTTFDELVAAALQASGNKVIGISGEMATEIIWDILRDKAAELPALGRSCSREMAADLVFGLGQLRRAKAVPPDLMPAIGEKDQVLADLALVWQDYLSFLRSRGLADIEEQYCLAAHCLSAVPWLGQVRQLHLCWFFDFEPLQLDILQAVCALVPSVTLWLPYDHTAHEDYLEGTLAHLRRLGFKLRRQEMGKRSELTASLFLLPPKPAAHPFVRGLGAPRLKQELELVAREIKSLAAAGAKAEDICLVVPGMDKYLPLMRSMYKEQGIDLSAPLLADLTCVPWVREILKIWRAAARGWDRESLLLVAGNVYITEHLPADYDADALEWTLYNLRGDLRGRQWLDKLDRERERLSSQLEACQEQWLEKGMQQPLALYEKARSGIEAWLQLGSILSGQRRPGDHCRILQDLLRKNEVRLCPPEDTLPAVRDRAAWAKLAACLKDYLACCRLLERNQSLGPGQFLEDISPWLKQDMSLERSSPGDIQVLSPAQARGMNFPWVFIIGLNQGVFPLSGNEHWLLERVARLQGQEQAGRGKALAQQKIYFHCAVAAAEEGLYLSRQLPGIDEGAEISAFWREAEAAAGAMPCQYLGSSDLLPQAQEATSAGRLAQRLAYDLARGRELPAPALDWLKGQESYLHLLRASQAVQHRESSLPADNYDGALAASSPALRERFGQGIYSISRLEQYSRCPFAFFARHCLRLDPAPRDQEEYSPLEKGTLLHWLLEKFYQEGFIDRADASQPETIRRPLAALARQWLQEQGCDPHELIWKLRGQDAVQMVAALVETDLAWLQRTGLKPVLFEASFGLPGSAVGTVSPGEGMYFHGKIDRIDVLEGNGETWAVVYDYKTSNEVTRSKILAGKSLQIPVYLTAVRPLLEKLGYRDVRVMGGGYYVIKKAKLAGGIWNKEFTSLVKSGLGSLEQEEFAELEQTLAKVSRELHAAILAGNFVPAPDGDACKWCDYARCCRYDKYRFKLKGGAGIETQ